VRLNRLIWRALVALLDLNAKLYGREASHELCRDAMGRYTPLTYNFGEDRIAAELFAKSCAERNVKGVATAVCEGRWAVTIDETKWQ
jgi:hypothetical protein